MTRRIFCKVLLVVAAIFGVLALSGVLLAQGRSEEAFERVREVQERHTDVLMAKPGVVGTAVGLDDDGGYAILVLLERPGVAGIPQGLEGVTVKGMVTGKIYALKPPTDRPPKPPRALTATAVGSSQINLDWKDNREPDLSHYNVFRSTSSGGPYSPLVSEVSVSEYSDTGLTSGTTYYYVVTAVNTSDKESAYSNVASATTEGGHVEPPVAPTNLTATAVSSSQIDLTWTDNADNEKGFKIERNSLQIDIVGANVTSYSDTGLDPSTTYTYRVRAYNDEGDSAYSNDALATTPSESVEDPIWPRPVHIGVSTGHPNITAGTIGCRVKDSNGTLYLLSNNHVYADENRASIGNNVLVPGPYDGGQDPRDRIGTLIDFVQIKFGPRGRNTVDAAIALLDMVDLDGDGQEDPTVLNDTPSGGYGTPNSATTEAYVGQVVQKYGRTTGLTGGVVDGVNATVRVWYDSGFAYFVKQILITPGAFSAGGDSGSLIVTDDLNCNPIGLLFAGSSTMTVANPIDEVLSSFGVDVDGK